MSATSTPAASGSVAASASASPASAPAPSASAPAEQPAKIGLLAPFSGSAAAFGQDMLKGAQMAVDEANGAGGVNAKRLAIDQGDDKADASVAPDTAKKLITDGVFAAIGPATSGSALAAEAAFSQAKVPMLTPSASDPRVTDAAAAGTFVFRTTGRWDQEPLLIADYLLKQPASKIALIGDKSAYGQLLAAGMRQALSKAGQQPVADETVDSGTKDFGPLAAKIKPQAPTGVFYGGYAMDGAALAKALKAVNLQATLAMGDAGIDQALLTAAGSAAVGMVFAYAPDPQQVASASSFLDGYKRRYGVPASQYAISTYDTARLVLDAARRAGSFDADPVRQAIAAPSGFTGAYWGPVSFDDKGDLQAQTYALWTVKDGRFMQQSATSSAPPSALASASVAPSTARVSPSGSTAPSPSGSAASSPSATGVPAASPSPTG
ncbi:MAG TPA: branched-chain amino acid ABC transporter substrate-binding protein [Chloroflexota bacterium]|nr:branched-chain amino acid ABC transporter substrate-binding protein [Chloroflexota bacterium]